MLLYEQYNDRQLLALLTQGDERAFTTLYDRYWKKLFVIAAKRMSSLEDAEEIVQDIFTTLWHRREQLAVSGDLANYLAVSVKYRVIKTLDRYYHQRRYNDALAPDEQIDNSTQEWLAFEELREEIAKYVKQLPEKCQLVFQLSREEGYSQKQIAETLHISEKTVEGHLGKAFKVLRSKLASLMVALL